MKQHCTCSDGDDRLSKTIVGSIERPRYSPGLILEAADLTSAVDYTRNLSRLLFRNLFGCGVVCGLDITAKPNCGLIVTTGRGLAIDGCGDPVEVKEPITITLNDRDGVDSDGTPIEGYRWPTGKPQFFVTLCGGEKRCAPRELDCDCDDGGCVAETTRYRAQATVSISAKSPDCACRQGDRDRRDDDDRYRNPCVAEHPDGCADDCGCGSGCDCGCCVLLGVVAWVEVERDKMAWQCFAAGARRYVRPAFTPDPKCEGPTFSNGELRERIVAMDDRLASSYDSLRATVQDAVDRTHADLAKEIDDLRTQIAALQPPAPPPATDQPKGGGGKRASAGDNKG